ncbi:MAG: hypothetical protein F4Z01_09215 [Gammaproteobacteria bacterium]|nr:hypothetical protein [Gammaproteobacteria bacterium]MYF38181.1 hypothetical protein [Gammaproteobacteria bacterium]
MVRYVVRRFPDPEDFGHRHTSSLIGAFARDYYSPEVEAREISRSRFQHWISSQLCSHNLLDLRAERTTVAHLPGYTVA